MEGIRLSQQRSEQSKKLDAIKERKIQELRQVGIPDKYVKEIERQVHSKPKNSFSMSKK
jgi:hypothetical protein